MIASPWHVSGTYFEACNCLPICPCRRIGSTEGGRSTFGTCYGTLSWHITYGRVGDVDLSGLSTALSLWYRDDEPGSPWQVILYVDGRGDVVLHLNLGGRVKILAHLEGAPRLRPK